MSSGFEESDQEGQSAPDRESRKRKSGGQPGNQNARKGAMSRSSFHRLLVKHGAKLDGEGTPLEMGLDSVLAYLLKECTKGSVPALSALMDRLDGKPPQSIDVSGDFEPRAIYIERP